MSPPTKRRRAIRKLKGDPETMMLGDLIFYNPPKTVFQLENTPKTEHDELNNNNNNDDHDEPSPAQTSEQDSQPKTILNFDERGDPLDEKEQKENENNPTPADDDGDQMLMFDEKGNIVIKNPEALEESQTHPVEKVRSNPSMTTYNSFRRAARSKGNWTTDETAIFFSALEMVGTDFSLMEAAFFKDLGRTRKELHRKFKREEKFNRAFVDSILSKSLTSQSERPALEVTAHKTLPSSTPPPPLLFGELHGSV